MGVYLIVYLRSGFWGVSIFYYFFAFFPGVDGVAPLGAPNIEYVYIHSFIYEIHICTLRFRSMYDTYMCSTCCVYMKRA